MKRKEQISFAASGFDRFMRSTKRAAFLSEMDRIVPWERLCAVVAPHYPTGEGGLILSECYGSAS
jgi:transposase, IS5 family